MAGLKKRVVKHLKGDIAGFKKEAKEDKELIKALDKKTAKGRARKTMSKVKKVMREFKEGNLHSGSKDGKIVTNPSQAMAIGLSEAKKRNKR